MTVETPAPTMPQAGIRRKFRPTLIAAAAPFTTGVSFVRFERLTPIERIMQAPYRADPAVSSGTTGAAPHQSRGMSRWMQGGAKRLTATTDQAISTDQYEKPAR